MLHCVITTIQQPTDSVRRLATALSGNRGHLVIAGDTKGPIGFDLSTVPEFAPEQLTFLDIDGQLASGFDIAAKLPTKHYCRKNVGYLEAMRRGATCIYETDDDNHPLDSWQPRSEYVDDVGGVATADETDAVQWINVYRHFSDQHIWPRGLPLECIHDVPKAAAAPAWTSNRGAQLWAPIQQGLADGAPDVDAVWRLVLDREFTFDRRQSVSLARGQWCPFNTQTTWWWPAAYPLMYVPSYCSFRMCDIWKSFIAQRCLWELDAGIVFHAPEVWQARNLHNLMRDFHDEVPGYEHNQKLARTLADQRLTAGVENVSSNLRACYSALVEVELFPEKELELVEAWIAAVDSLMPIVAHS